MFSKSDFQPELNAAFRQYTTCKFLPAFCDLTKHKERSSLILSAKHSKGLSFLCHVSKGCDLGVSLLQCNFNYQGLNPSKAKNAALVLSVIEMFTFTFKMHFLDCSWTFYRMTVLKWTVCKVRSRRLSIWINVCHTPFCTWHALHAHRHKWTRKHSWERCFRRTNEQIPSEGLL